MADVNVLLNNMAADIDAARADLSELKTAQYRKNSGGISPQRMFARQSGEDMKGGYKSLGHFAADVMRCSQQGNGWSDQMKAYISKTPSGLSETQAADGGFLIPPEFSNTIFQRVYDNDLLQRTDSYTCVGNTMKFPAIDETSRVDGSRFGGVQAYWLDEASQVTKSKPKLRNITLALNKLACLGYITDELLTDAGIALDQYLTRLFAEEIKFQVGAAIYLGNGVGKPLGITNAANPSLIAVSKETGQAAATVVTENIVKMWARMWAPSKKTAVWLINQDVTPQLFLMTISVGASGLPVYMPPGGLSAAPYATLMGRPVIEIEFAQTLGTQGDICLADLSQYITLSKGSVNTEMSMHLRFDFDELAFRVIFRVDGKPWWNNALTPYNGTNTYSPFIALAAR